MIPTPTVSTAGRKDAFAQPPLPERHQLPRDGDALTADIVVGILGICSFAVSFKHVVQTADRAGQTGWVAYAIAVSVELMALGAVSELRRRKRRGHPARWPSSVLVLGVVMSLAANLAVAQPTPWGYVMAAWPAVAFLAAAGIIESRRADWPTAAAAPEPSGLLTDPDDEAGTDATDEDPRAPAEQPPVQPAEQPQQQEPAEPDTDAGPEADHQPPAERPTKLRVITELLAAMRTDPHWRPDYDELIRRTGWSRSWCEKRVGEARTLHQDGTEPDVTEEPLDRTAAPRPSQPAPDTPGRRRPAPPSCLPARTEPVRGTRT